MSIFKKVAKRVKKSARSVVREVSPYARAGAQVVSMPVRGYRDTTRALRGGGPKRRRRG